MFDPNRQILNELYRHLDADRIGSRDRRAGRQPRWPDHPKKAPHRPHRHDER